MRCEKALNAALANNIVPDNFFTGANSREADFEDAMQRLRNDQNLTIRNALEAVFNERGMTFTGSPAIQQRKTNALAKCGQFDNVGGSDSITPTELLTQIARNRLPPNEREAGVKKAREAFLGQQDNLMLRSWEYSIATMVEGMPGETSRGTMMQNGLKNVSNTTAESIVNGAPFSPSNKNLLLALKDQLITEFDRLVKAETATRYDPSVKKRAGGTSSDGSSSTGGYCLFIGDKKIETDSDYAESMERLLQQAWSSIESSATGIAKMWGPTLVANLAKEFGKSSFHEQVVESVQGPIDEGKSKMVKPWTFHDGGNTDHLLQLYYNSPTPLQTEVAGNDVNTGLKLGKFLLNKMKAMDVDKKLGTDGGFETSSIPVRTIGVHAFNLTPSSPGVLAILKEFDNPEIALDRFQTIETEKNQKRMAYAMPLSNPLDGAAKSMVDAAVTMFPENKRAGIATALATQLRTAGATITAANAKTILRAGVLSELVANYSHIADEKRQEYADHAANGASACILNEIVPKEEFEPVINLCLERLKIPQNKHDGIRKELLKTLKDEDAKDREGVMKTIEDELKKQNEPPAEGKLAAAMKEPRGLVIADANWGDGDHRTLMSLIVNPETGVMEMWQMNEDGTNPKKMKQETWVQNNRWQVFSDPREFGGTMGNQAWETKRMEHQDKLSLCATKGVGDVRAMQNALDFADKAFLEGRAENAETALANLKKMTDDALKLDANIFQVCSDLGAFQLEIENVATPGAKFATQQVKSLIAAIQTIGTTDERDKVLNRYAALCTLIKAGQQPLGVAVDVEAVLKQTA